MSAEILFGLVFLHALIYLHILCQCVMYILSKNSPILNALRGLLCLGGRLTHCTLVSLAVAGVPTAASCSPSQHIGHQGCFPSMCLCHWMLQHVNLKFGICQQNSIDEASISKVTLRTSVGMRVRGSMVSSCARSAVCTLRTASWTA